MHTPFTRQLIFLLNFYNCVIREKIWYEMADIKTGECYLAGYLNRCKNHKKIFQCLTILFSTTGVFGWRYLPYRRSYRLRLRFWGC